METAEDAEWQAKVNSQNEDVRYSRETYWKPQFNKNEWSLLNDRTAVEIASKSKFLDEATKWLYAKKKDTEVFAIYGIGDGSAPTVLYASGGKKATSDLARFTSFLKEHDYGTVTYAKTAVRWAEIVSSIKRKMHGDYDADGHRRKTLELDGILAEASKRLRRGDNDGSTENSGNVSYSREPETLSELRRREDSFSDCVFSAFSSRHPHQGCFLAYMGKTVTDQPAQFQTKNMNKS